eukprot:m51a1_g4960 hypothetical protein (1004) ;mRNA; f:356674-361100
MDRLCAVDLWLLPRGPPFRRYLRPVTAAPPRVPPRSRRRGRPATWSRLLATAGATVSELLKPMRPSPSPVPGYTEYDDGYTAAPARLSSPPPSVSPPSSSSSSLSPPPVAPQPQAGEGTPVAAVVADHNALFQRALTGILALGRRMDRLCAVDLWLLPRGPPFRRYLRPVTAAPPRVPPRSRRRGRPATWSRLLATAGATVSELLKPMRPSPSPVPGYTEYDDGYTAAPARLSSPPPSVSPSSSSSSSLSPPPVAPQPQAGEGTPVAAVVADHNALFQRALTGILSLNSNTGGRERMALYKELADVSADFVQQAVNYGRIIISEMGLPNEMKTIKPVDSGGRAGGLKFTLPDLGSKLYSSYDQMAKVAGHELHGCSRVEATLMQLGGDIAQRCRCPLSAVVDYLGWRVFAQAELPLRGPASLVYGSEDGGVTTAFDGAVHADLLKVAARLGLAEHARGDVRLAMPFDLEVHRTGPGGRCYLVDFSRVFPPEATGEAPGDVCLGQPLACLLRPEFVAGYERPLNPDGFKFSEATFEPELVEATRVLRNVQTVEFARVLAQTDPDDGFFELVPQLHSAGINVRYLGFVLDVLNRMPASSTPFLAEWRLRIMVEMSGRAITKVVNNELRRIAYTNAQQDSVYKRRIVELLNVFLGDGVSREAAQDWWGRVDSYCRTFWPQPPSGVLLPSTFNLAAARRRCALFQHISEALGLVWYGDAWDVFSKREDALACREPLQNSSLRAIEPKVKRMNVSWHARARYLGELYAHKVQLSASQPECRRVLRDAEATYALAIRGEPTNSVTLRSFAMCLCFHATECEAAGDSEGASRCCARARGAINLARATVRENVDTTLLYIAAALEDRDGKFEHAAQLYTQSEELDPFHVNCLQMHADMLAELARNSSDDAERCEYRKRAESNYTRCLACIEADLIKPCNNYAVMLLEQGRVQEAEEMLLVALGSILNRDTSAWPPGSTQSVIANNCLAFSSAFLDEATTAALTRLIHERRP